MKDKKRYTLIKDLRMSEFPGILKNKILTYFGSEHYSHKKLYDIKTKKGELFEKCKIYFIQNGTYFDSEKALERHLHSLIFTIPSSGLQCILDEGYSFRLSSNQ